jgi:excisionase family DNA binding protein
MRHQESTTKNTMIDDLRTRKEMMTTTEIMALLRITRGTLCGWCRAGKLPHMRLPDNSYLFDPGTVSTWMQKRTIEGG